MSYLTYKIKENNNNRLRLFFVVQSFMKFYFFNLTVNSLTSQQAVISLKIDYKIQPV